MKISAISDTHFSHKKLVDYGRPVDFEAQILAGLESSSGDLLIHCGDFCIGDNEENTRLFMQAARGWKQKVLVRGNHDPQSDVWYLERGWSMVCTSFANKYFGKNLVFTHRPARPISDADFNIHGHMHGKGTSSHRFEGETATYYDPKYHLDAGVDLHNFAPVNLEKLISQK